MSPVGVIFQVEAFLKADLAERLDLGSKICDRFVEVDSRHEINIVGPLVLFLLLNLY